MEFWQKHRLYIGLFLAGVLFLLIGAGLLYRQRRGYIPFSAIEERGLGEEELTEEQRKTAEQFLNQFPSPCQKEKSIMACLKEDLACAELCEAQALAEVQLVKQGKSKDTILRTMNHIALHWLHPHR